MSNNVTETLEFNAKVTWTGGKEGDITVEGKPLLPISSPIYWEGKPDYYSPQDLFIAAITGCYITTFATMTKRMRQTIIAHQASGRTVLQKHPEGGWYFSDVYIIMDITVPKDANISQVERAVMLTKKYCQVSRALNSQVHVQPNIRQED
ncbi:MAG: OsmC family protein [Promethearchaeota archaeon]